jgi:hypothetical protein
MDFVSETILQYLYHIYMSNPRNYSHIYQIHQDIYEWTIQTYGYEITQNDMSMALEYLQSIGFIQMDMDAYRLTSHGKAHIERPRPDYEALGYEQQEKSNSIATKALYIAALSLLVAIASLYLSWHLIVSP